MPKLKPVPRKRYVLLAVEAGEDQVEANRMMRQVCELLPKEMKCHITTVTELPRPLALKR